MIRMVVCKNANGAVSYFTDALEIGDYYAEGVSYQGTWHGKGAELLGLTDGEFPGSVTQEQFKAMAFNRHPTQDGPLTERTVSNRRIGYDINFHPPKSFSIQYAITKDPALLNAFRESVVETMTQMESEMKCRVRVNGMDEDRLAANICYALFIHFTSRPVDGQPDPHVHAHAFVFNSVNDEVENKWKAGQFGDLKRDCSFFEACFHARLTSKLVELGHHIERRGKAWEIANIPQSEITKFSRRTSEIEAKATELGIHDPEEKSGIGAKTRKKKIESRPWYEFRDEWAAKLDPTVKNAILKRTTPGQGAFAENVEKSSESAVDLAISNVFERKSVVTERQFLTSAIKSSLGRVGLPALEKQLGADDRFIRASDNDGQTLMTTKEVMAEEKRMIAFARDGRGTRAPLAPGHEILDQRLNDQQREAVADVLNSTDRVVIVRGGAGTGKTTLLTEIFEAIKKNTENEIQDGRDLVTFLAPSADASRGVLRSEGFANADTVAKFLVDKRRQEKARDGVLWIDEAGLLGSRTMGALCQTADKLNARIMLSGDSGQHQPVERGQPLRLLPEYAGVEPSSVTKVLRQKGLYKSAVEHLARHEYDKGFDGLKKLGCIHEMDEAKAHKEIAYNFSNQIERGRSALVVSPTHAEGGRVTRAIREELKRRGIVKEEEKRFDRLEDLRLTDGQKCRAYEYEAGHVIQFHQNVKGFQAGKQYGVLRNIPGEGVTLTNGNLLPLDQAKSFNVYKLHQGELELCQGDTLRITANGKTVGDRNNSDPIKRPHALNNGATYTVKEFTNNGDIVLTNGWTIQKEFRHFAHGYCSTSHSSQGKTVDAVFLSECAGSFPAASAEQFYVSVSRGRSECYVYTDDVEELRSRIEQTRPSRAAVELCNKEAESEGVEQEHDMNGARETEDRASEFRSGNGRHRDRDGMEREFGHV